MSSDRELLRHTVATLAYRGGKAIHGAPPNFAGTRVCESARSAIENLCHMGDLLEWAVSLASGGEVWLDKSPRTWDLEVQRFFESLAKLDARLASDTPLNCPAERLFQGPIADALTHVGQLATLRRVAGSPVRGENYFKADIAVGRVGPVQSDVRREFD